MHITREAMRMQLDVVIELLPGEKDILLEGVVEIERIVGARVDLGERRVPEPTSSTE